MASTPSRLLGVTGPPFDGSPLPTILKLRQHEVQVAPGPGGCLAAAWTDDTKLEGVDGWTCGFAVSSDGGLSWSAPRFHKRPDFAVTGNPAVAIDERGAIFAVAMSAQSDYGSGILEFSRSTDAGRTWSPWTRIVSRRNGIPDRPKLAVDPDGALHLIFSDIEHTGQTFKSLRSTIHITSSLDRGETWSTCKPLSGMPTRSRWFIDGHQGASILALPNRCILGAWADYYGNVLHLAKIRGFDHGFEARLSMRLRAVPGTGIATFLLGATFGTPATELAVDAAGGNVVVSVHEAHAMGHILLAGSQDGGASWSHLTRLTRRGTNASFGFDSKGRLHAIWTELRGRHVDTRYAVSGDRGRTFEPATSLAGGGGRVSPPRSIQEREECEAALGSYQSLGIDRSDRACAVWVDLRAGLTRPKLYRSVWSVRATVPGRAGGASTTAAARI